MIHKGAPPKANMGTMNMRPQMNAEQNERMRDRLMLHRQDDRTTHTYCYLLLFRRKTGRGTNRPHHSCRALPSTLHAETEMKSDQQVCVFVCA